VNSVQKCETSSYFEIKGNVVYCDGWSYRRLLPRHRVLLREDLFVSSDSTRNLKTSRNNVVLYYGCPYRHFLPRHLRRCHVSVRKDIFVSSDLTRNFETRSNKVVFCARRRALLTMFNQNCQELYFISREIRDKFLTLREFSF